MIKEFKEFISRGNVVDMAIGIIMGTAFTAIVNSMVNDMLMPPIGRLTGGMDFTNFFVSLNGEHYASLADAKRAGAPTINYGVFINAVINFLIISGVAFFMVRQVNRLRRSDDDAKAPAAPTPSETLLTEIRDLLRAQHGGAPAPGTPAAAASKSVKKKA